MFDLVVRPQNPFEEAILPQPDAELTPCHDGRSLPKDGEAWAQLGVLGQTFEQQMQVIRHEDVRKNCEGTLATCQFQQRRQSIDQAGVDENLLPIERAERQEIAEAATVIERTETWGPTMGHASSLSTRMPGNTGGTSVPPYVRGQGRD